MNRPGRPRSQLFGEVGIVAGQLLRLARLGIQRPQSPQRGHLLTQLDSLDKAFLICGEVSSLQLVAADSASQQIFEPVRAKCLCSA